MPLTELTADMHPQRLPARTATPALLVSVRNVAEAQLAASLGVGWIDLKDPDAGSLGACQAATAQAVAQALQDFPRRSAAAGELREAGYGTALSLAPLFPVVKVGLAGLAAQSNWRLRFAELAEAVARQASVLVPVIYADFLRCEAPQPRDVLQLAQQLQSPYVLLDTYHKVEQDLFDCLSLSAIEAIGAQATAAGCQLVVAGSLSLDQLSPLMQLPLAAIAVRGAVCHGDRRSPLCPQKVQLWVSRLHGAS
ncbi:MAG: hypothetical protein KDA45_05515 [Planctomycetales bacterium]|nr:hypothetical protein [Planctomycetales bacterium]